MAVAMSGSWYLKDSRTPYVRKTYMYKRGASKICLAVELEMFFHKDPSSAALEAEAE